MKVSDPIRVVYFDESIGDFVDVDATHPLPVGGAPSSEPVVVVPGDTAAQDAFGRSRVSMQGFRLDNTFTYDKMPLLFDEVVSGTGALTHNSNLRAVYLSTGGTVNAAAATLQASQYTPYTPGNSQQIVITGNLNPDGVDFTNVVAEIGYGDAANAVGFRLDEDGASIFLRSSISGAAVDLVNVDQAFWNENQLLDTDWTKSQIFMIDFQSLAVGRIRFYLDRNGVAVLLHEIHNDNLRIGPYWQLATLPPFWSVKNIGTANAVARVLAICVTVKSEGAPDLQDLPGFAFSATRAGSLKTVSTTLVPVLSLRLKATYNTFSNRGLVVPVGLQIVTDNSIHWKILKNPTTLTGASWSSVDANSICEFDIAATVVTGGRALITGYSGTGNNRAAGSDHGIAGKGEIHLNAAGVSDILTLAAVRVSTSDADVGASINFKEIR